MRRFVLFAAIGLIAAPVLADGQPHRYKGMRHLSYDLGTGEITWLDNGQGQTRARSVVWDASVPTGFFINRGPNLIALDWGDLADAAATPVTQFQFAYATSEVTVDGIRMDMTFFTNDNGRDSVGRVLVNSFRLVGLPGVNPDNNLPNGTGSGFTVTVPIDATPMDLSGPDLDPAPNGNPGTPTNPYGACLDIFGASDFSYSQNYREHGLGLLGPIIVSPAADPNLPPCTGLGSENVYDRFSLDPNNPPDPNAVVLPDVDYVYDNTFFFGGNPFAQYQMTLFTGEPNGACPQEGCSTDLDGDCQIALSDLAIVLGNFGQTGAGLQGDFDNDGDVDLGDLALILSEFGNNCN